MKTLDALLLGLGLLLAACGYVKWWTARESAEEVRMARGIGYLVPGWTMVAMGYIALRFSPTMSNRDSRLTRSFEEDAESQH